jgi:hypothetical protein
MKVGDLVRNVIAMRTNPVVHSLEEEIPRGTIGVITKVRDPDAFNDTVDAVMETASGAAYCGGYEQGFFEVISESR